MAVELQPVESMVQVICTISRNGVRMCNLSITAEKVDREKAAELVAEKARAWIADYLTRRSGPGAGPPANG